jgi:hypothetical protein
MKKEAREKQLVGDKIVLPFLFGDDSKAAENGACWWAYGNNAGAAYAAFLAHGRGLLWGPLAVDLDGNQLDHSALTAAAAAGKGFELLMAYLRPDDYLLSTLPADLREKILASVKEYEPKREINLLCRRADGSVGFFIGRFGLGGFMCATPAEFHEARQKGMSPAEFYDANRDKFESEMARKQQVN